MKLSINFILGLLVCIGLAGYYGYLGYSSFNVDAAPAAPAATAPLPYTEQLFDDPLFAELGTKDVNGPLPVTFTPEEQGNDDPFK
jgi:hypothetical protein